MNLRTAILGIFLTSYCGIAVPWPFQNEVPNIRVLICKDISKVTLSGSKINIYNASHKLLGELPSPIVIASESGTLSVNFKNVRERALLFYSNQPLQVQGIRYRGKIHVLYNAGKLLVMNELSLEEYLYSVVSSEMPKDAPREALRAQGVAARTFALFHKNQNGKLPYDLDIPSKTQAYRGIEAESESGKVAIQDTQGLILHYHRKPFPSFFHTRCGGYTRSANEVWSSAGESPQGVECQPCLGEGVGLWKFQMTAVEFRRRLLQTGYRLPNRFRISLFRDSANRVSSVRVDDLKISAEELRRILGPDQLRSSFFKIRTRHNNIYFYGRGWGHGVGLCQYGAIQMAKNNRYHYKKILRWYYPDTRLTRAY